MLRKNKILLEASESRLKFWSWWVTQQPSFLWAASGPPRVPLGPVSSSLVTLFFWLLAHLKGRKEECIRAHSSSLGPKFTFLFVAGGQTSFPSCLRCGYFVSCPLLSFKHLDPAPFPSLTPRGWNFPQCIVTTNLSLLPRALWASIPSMVISVRTSLGPQKFF